MQTPPGEAFPFSTVPATESAVKTEAQTKESEAAAKETAVPAEAGRRVTLIEQFMRNRPGSKGARFLGFMDAIKALFVSPTGPDGRRQISGNRSLGMANSLMGIFAAFKGEAPAGLRDQMGLPPVGNTPASDETVPPPVRPL
ncbi:MAG TPA: hypothetical protein PKV72_03160 [Candidatus Peribacteria bacterium]|nr:hypothetical protein [Candidatus Peribacteria bacterium]